MGGTFEVATLEDFKQMAKEYFGAVKTSSIEELDNGFKCLAIAYLNLHDKSERAQAEAHIILELAGKKLIEKEMGFKAA